MRINGRHCHKVMLTGILLAVVLLPQAYAKPLAPPDDPTQSITYWKQHTLSAGKDPLAAMAQEVFTVLLRAWDNSRLEPGLYVVRSTAGPWAASLADGNILLSRAAIETCMQFGKGRAEHLLAFVLAHELAHQRADDLWHQRFFRLIGNQGPELKRQVLQELQADKKLWNDVGQKEIQADHDGLIMMASVGYDPYQVLDKKDFFTQWVENIWQASCSSQPLKSDNSQACQQAKNRALRAHAQLTTVATQSTLYEMGVQAFIAGQYQQARRYLTAYGRDYTNRAVLSALGLSHFAEALEIHQQLVQEHDLHKPAFYFPLLLDASAGIIPGGTKPAEVRGAASQARIAQQKQKMHKSLEQSINYYEKAIRLEPEHAKTYLLLALAYLLEENNYMVRGVIQGKYIHKFGHDAVADLLLAMTSGMEGHIAKTERAFSQLIHRLKQPVTDAVIPVDLLIYTAYYNSAVYAEYLNKHKQAAKLWQQLASQAKSSGHALLFRLAVSHVTGQTLTQGSPASAPNINGIRLGDRLQKKIARKQPYHDLWIEGEQYRVYHSQTGSRYVVNSDKQVINAWQDAGQARLEKTVKPGDDADRVLKVFGLPSRQLHMMSGDYLAYDRQGLAIHVVQNKIAGWFLYQAK